MESGTQESIMLWRLMSSGDARNLCIAMFIAFWAALSLGVVLANYFNNQLDPVFYFLGGFFLGVSEVLYWVYKGLKS